MHRQYSKMTCFSPESPILSNLQFCRLLVTTQHPCMHPPHTPHGMSANFVKLCSQNIPLKATRTAVEVPSVNNQPWCFTNNSLGLPHAYSLSVCLFLRVCVVCVYFLPYLSVYLCCERCVVCVWFCNDDHIFVFFFLFLRIQ